MGTSNLVRAADRPERLDDMKVDARYGPNAIVDWGSSLAAAFKSHKRHADGSYLQTKATARFTGLQVFEWLDGGTATIPTFVLSE